MLPEERRMELTRAVRDLTEGYRAAGYFPSACVRVFDRERTLACVCVGDAKEDSLFDMASLTKIATATQVLMLVREGRVQLEDPLEQLFPEIRESKLMRGRLQGITLFHLLTHTSTILDWYPFYVMRGHDFWEVLEHVLRTTEPVQGMVYSDINFMLAGILVSRLRQKPLDRCLREDLVEPLQLGSMLYRPGTGNVIPSSYGNPIEERMCAERGLVFDGFRDQSAPLIGQTNDGNCHYFFGDVCGLAGIFATAEAYERLCRFYMNTEDPLFVAAQQEQKGARGRGLGFQTGVSYPHGCGHTGFTGTGIYFSRSRGVGAVSMTNRLFYREQNPNASGDFRRALHELALAMAGEREET